jgi:hypothetical protein
MKTPLVVLTIGAVLSAVLVVSSRPDAASAGSTSTAASAAYAPLRTLPPVAAPAQQTLYGHIKSLARKGNRYLMKFDPALLLSGLPAEQAAFEDTGSRDVPNDTYTLDEGHRLLTYVVPLSARVTVITGLPGRGPCTTPVSVPRLAQIVNAGAGFYFWIKISPKYPSPVLSLDQQYHP